MITKAKPKRLVNPLLLDPSRTTLLRKSFLADMRRRIAKLKSAIWDLIVTEDALGHRRPTPRPFTINVWSDAARKARWAGHVKRVESIHHELTSRGYKTTSAPGEPVWQYRKGEHGINVVQKNTSFATAGSWHHWQAKGKKTETLGKGNNHLSLKAHLAKVEGGGSSVGSSGPKSALGHRIHESLSKSKEHQPKAKGHVQVNIQDHELKKIGEVLGRKDITREHLAGMAGALPGSTVHLKKIEEGTKGPKHVTLQIEHPDYEAMRSIHQYHIHNDYIIVNEAKQGQGIGLAAFNHQVKHATAVGMSEIRTEPTRGDSVQAANGYYTWARLGYSGKIPANVKVPAKFKASTVQDLMKTKEGREWWKEHGDTFKGSFSLIKGSTSRKVLAAYVKERRKREKAVTNWEEDQQGYQVTANGATAGIGQGGREDIGQDMGQAGQGRIVTNTRFKFLTDDAKLDAFNKWFENEVKKGILEVDHQGKPWTAKYVDSAYRKGKIRSYLQGRKEDLSKSDEWLQGSRDQFLRSAFDQPEMVSKLRLLGTRNYEQLKGITADMSSQLNRVLASGIAAGKSPMMIAREINKQIDGIGKRRAEVLARTEIVHSAAEGQLDGFEDLGVKELQITAELITAGDRRVCFPASTLVRTDKGDVPIETVDVGDLVLTRKGLRPVVGLTKRLYSGSMTEVSAGGKWVMATSNHLFWLQERGWTRADSLLVGEHVYTTENQFVKIRRVSDFVLGKPAYFPPHLFDVPGFAKILGGISVPIGSIAFDGDLPFREQEVECVLSDCFLLDMINSKSFKGYANGFFNRCFGGGCFVASVAAKTSVRLGFLADFLSTSIAGDVYRRSSTFFRTMFPIDASCFVCSAVSKSLAACKTFKVGGAFRFSSAADGAVVVPMGYTSFYGDFLFALWTCFSDWWAFSGLFIARPAAVFASSSNAATSTVDFLAARGARYAFTILSRFGKAWMAAKLPFAFDPAMHRESVSACEAVVGKWHVEPPSKVSYRLLGTIPVYCLQVEGEEEFFANGILVHNCPKCSALAGKRFTVQQARGVIPIHPMCRCSWTASTGKRPSKLSPQQQAIVAGEPLPAKTPLKAPSRPAKAPTVPKQPTTAQEVYKAAKTAYGAYNLDLQGDDLPLDRAKAVTKHIEKQLARMKQASKYIAGYTEAAEPFTIELKKDPVVNRKGTLVGGQYLHKERKLIISAGGELPTYDLTPRVGGYVVAADVGDVFRHEYGHQVWFNALTDADRREFEEKFGGMDASKVSTYAATNTAELWAECFTAITSSKYFKGLLPKALETWLAAKLGLSFR